jgi:hypothetical protein
MNPRPRYIRKTPTLDTNAYGIGDHMGTLMTLTNAVQGIGCGVLQSLTVADGDKQSKGITCLFFSASPTLASVDNAALDIADAQLHAKFLGAVSVVTADYEVLNAGSVACVKNINLPLVADDGNTIYAMLMADEAATHAAAGVTIGFGIVV